MESHDSPPKISAGSFYTPLLISMIGILSSSFALVLYHFVLVKLCLRRTQRDTTSEEAQTPSTQFPSPATGVDQKLLETIPIIAYATHEEGDQLFFRKDQSECVVCLGELEHGEMVRLLPNCKHAFHVPCIDEWFVAHMSCPICRSPIVAEAPLELDNGIPISAPPSPPPQSTSCPDASNRAEFPSENFHDEQGTRRDISGNNVASSSGVKNSQHFPMSVSPVLPTERTALSTLGITGLRRSLSLQDQFSVIIDTQQQRESGRDCSPSSSSPSVKDDFVYNRTAGPISVKHLDRVSSKLLLSLSRLRLGKNSDILPC